MNEVWENRTSEYNNQASIDIQALNKYLRDWGKEESDLQLRLQEGLARGEAEYWKSRREQLESYYEEEGAYASKLNRLKIELEEGFTSSGTTTLNARLIEEQRVKVNFEKGFYEFQQKNLEALNKQREAAMEEYFKKNGYFTEAEREAHMSEAQDAADAQTAAQAASLRDTEKQRQIYARRQALEAQKADKETSKQRRALMEQENKAFRDTFFGVGVTVQDRAQALRDAFSGDMAPENATDAEAKQIGIVQGIDAIMTSLSNLAAQLDKQTDELAKKKSGVDTRLIGSKADTRAGSYYDKILKDITSNVGINGLVLQADVLTSLEAMVGKGIAYNVEQRAFLNTIKDKIATTFNAADSTLLRLVRIQQQDTTAGRLGMEAALNAFLNNMYETTEYLSDVAASVRSSLEEMESLMGSSQATEIEFQVQKWMGSMYSVGMSQTAVQGITEALGKVASGDVSGITGGGTGNLMVMAANEAGISISDILTNGLNSDETNRLLQAMVNYLAEMADSSSNSLVVQQQLANVYGLKASDLRAITNLAVDAKTMSSISNNNLTYSNMLNELNKTANSMLFRTSLGEILTNVWQNTQYTIASNIANNPVLYVMDKMATLLDNTVGGIALPAISVAGFGVDLETTVADLMRVASLSGSVLSSLGAAIGGIAGTVNPGSMLGKFGIGKGESKIVERGTGTVSKATSGSSTSSSGYASLVGNASSDDVLNATMAEADNTVNEKMVQAKEAEESDIMRRTVDEHIVEIYTLLDSVVSGEQSFTVRNVGGNVFSSSSGSSSDSGFENTPWGKGGETGIANLITA